ncbi:MAG: hypothetical protein LUB59_05905 [Candidatus Gastranaerophilales bacterium]|nr:hypothetical protein [Candidatus Gastranaerophilales bacterium]
MKNKLLLLMLYLFIMQPVFSKNISGIWQNDLRTLFRKNGAVIYTINIRTFNAKDANNNEIIDDDEESGNFINAIDELDNLVRAGINTIHVLPVTPVGKLKAFGTAGSLYAISNLTEINPQIVSKTSELSGAEQAELFVKECHKRNLRVIFDIPGCGSYDMYVEHPEYFVKDEKGNPIIPLDWSDVRLFNSGSEEQPNEDLLELHKKFIDMLISVNADGIRADVARIKPASFWKELINYARAKDSEFLFLAEASTSWNDPVAKDTVCTPVDALFEAGFDAYLGNYFNLKNWKTSKEFISAVQSDLKMLKKFKEPKSAIGSFATHDEISPILIHGAKYSKMIIWLNTTLPLNSYYIDGFPTGDTYSYQWANKFAQNSQTDDEYYFTHNGKIDLFNFSRKPGGKDYSIYNEFLLANKFKEYYSSELSTAEFKPLRTSNPSVFAYARVTNNSSLVVFGNLDFNNPCSVTIKIPKFKPSKKILNLRVNRNLSNEYSNGKIRTTLEAGDIQVLLINNLVF